MLNIAVVFAGGIGSRMHSKQLPKQFLKVHGKPIIIYTLELFEQSDDIDAIVVACTEKWIGYLTNLVDEYGLSKVLKIVPGGKTGQLSIYNGLVAASKLGNGNNDENNIVLIHDGVRPFISEKTIQANINAVKKYGSAITCVKQKETILEVNEDNEVVQVPNRDRIRVARAPQSFYLNDILKIQTDAISNGKIDFVDSCTMMRYYNKDVHLVDGPQQNLKITTPEDFYIMKSLLDAQEDAQIFGLSNEL